MNRLLRPNKDYQTPSGSPVGAVYSRPDSLYGPGPVGKQCQNCIYCYSICYMQDAGSKDYCAHYVSPCMPASSIVKTGAACGRFEEVSDGHCNQNL